jgi:glycine dehydrogenase subunit 1
MLVYLTMMGPQGMKQLASISLSRAHYLAEQLCQIAGVKLAFDQPYFNEFALVLDRPAAEVLEQLKNRGVLGGIGVELFYPEFKNLLIVAVTEMNATEELDRYAEVLKEVLSERSNRSEVKAVASAGA